MGPPACAKMRGQRTLHRAMLIGASPLMAQVHGLRQQPGWWVGACCHQKTGQSHCFQRAAARAWPPSNPAPTLFRSPCRSPTANRRPLAGAGSRAAGGAGCASSQTIWPGVCRACDGILALLQTGTGTQPCSQHNTAPSSLVCCWCPGASSHAGPHMSSGMCAAASIAYCCALIGVRTCKCSFYETAGADRTVCSRGGGGAVHARVYAASTTASTNSSHIYLRQGMGRCAGG